MIKFLQRVFCLLAFLVSSHVWAEVSQLTNAQGETGSGDRLPVSAFSNKITNDINSYESVSIEPLESSSSGPLMGNKTVVMYSAIWCGICKRARRFFQVHKISFEEYDVEKTEKGRRDYKKLNGRGVPIILIANKRMNGFSVKRFRQLYAVEGK